jgi:hypothetical protein
MKFRDDVEERKGLNLCPISLEAKVENDVLKTEKYTCLVTAVSYITFSFALSLMQFDALALRER